MKNYVLVTAKPWHDPLFSELKKKLSGKWTRIRFKDEFTYNRLKKLDPDWVFIPHWSDLIPKNIYTNFNCVVFHMTDLPYGRGGSPLQNLIFRGHKRTMISAIKVDVGIDSGDIYLKSPLNLYGSAEEIFIRASKIILRMIAEIVKTNPVPKKQTGKVVIFKRRKPEESNMEDMKSISDIYDHIRMLDCEGYPNAFLEINNFRFEFNKAFLHSNKSITAHVKIIKK